MSLILPLPKYRVLVRTDLPEWARRSQTKMDRTTMRGTSAAITAPVIVPIPNCNSRAILTLSARLATGTLSLRGGGPRSPGQPFWDTGSLRSFDWRFRCGMGNYSHLVLYVVMVAVIGNR